MTGKELKSRDEHYRNSIDLKLAASKFDSDCNSQPLTFPLPSFDNGKLRIRKCFPSWGIHISS